MTIRRPDTSTVINHAQRLILNREGVADIATVADSAAEAAYRTFENDEEAAYLRGVRDILRWAAGGRPGAELLSLLEVEK